MAVPERPLASPIFLLAIKPTAATIYATQEAAPRIGWTALALPTTAPTVLLATCQGVARATTKRRPMAFPTPVVAALGTQETARKRTPATTLLLRA